MTDIGAGKKVWLNEVSFMRPVLLVLLVSYHAFAPFVGTWPMPIGCEDVELYRWLGHFSIAFLLEGYVFISGYIFTFQLISKNKFTNITQLAKFKFQRLLIPGILFSALYFLLFLNFSSVPYFLWRIINGVGHLWYLPCLFWCFLMHFLIILKIPKRWSNTSIVLLLSAGIALSVLPIPFRLNKALYYLVFFSGGGVFYQYKDIIAKNTTFKRCMMMCITFVVLFFLLNLLMEKFNILRESSDSVLTRTLFRVINLYLKAFLGWSGIVALYSFAVVYCRKNTLSNVIIKIGACGYGVYVFHQFILVYLYRYTSAPQLFGTYATPWILFLITVLFSVCLTLLIRQTSIGRKYL